MKKSSLVILVGAALCIGGGIWYFNHQPGVAASGQGGKNGQAPTTVSVVSPLRQDVPMVLQANGSVMPISSVELHPQTTSTIAKVHIREGQFVKQGELMFTLDARSEHANVEKAQAQVLRDRASVLDFERQLKRSVDLLSKNFIAQGAVDTLQSQLDAARALLAADQAALRSAQVDSSYTVLRAPQAGRVGAIGVYAGSLVQPTMSLTSITQLDPIDVSFTLPESSLSGLLAAQKAGDVAVAALLSDAGGKQLQGKLSFIDNAVDSATGVIKVKARFNNGSTDLWPGQYVNTQLTVHTLKDALVIPQNAIITTTAGTFVYSMEADQTAKMRNITRVYAFGLNAVVTGLNGDEKVVVDGKQNLRPGSKLRLAEKAPLAPSASAAVAVNDALSDKAA
ncbi:MULTISPECIES: efflux RND transporter periplasmic adaptor subunit [unclassified Janthinobacterium]|uniref:efflux RND transporter periplasmic adaptor subunit n=1 Tax=unclassified Janthinobacterium TaxID=2610881 RepID=UPI0016073305|nr:MULTISPECIES: efflux RND transporter periplasmic adaptor subunit [unclassified Janthinobacterium]MBB5605866.1 RND family efflux transporter MFP subunit [Janthinobacterium sp. S3T4]MBB5611215.1 RND family efflux transporter MFP subunit [Janthinobacterium sp. S3M3]